MFLRIFMEFTSAPTLKEDKTPPNASVSLVYSVNIYTVPCVFQVPC